MFGKDFRAEYDVAATLAAMKTQYFAKDGAEKWYGMWCSAQRHIGESPLKTAILAGKWPRYVPETIGKYYTALARGLESGGFGKDELLSKSFTELAKKVSACAEIIRQDVDGVHCRTSSSSRSFTPFQLSLPSQIKALPLTCDSPERQEIQLLDVRRRRGEHVHDRRVVRI
jgi:hypothetical protein